MKLLVHPPNTAQSTPTACPWVCAVAKPYPEGKTWSVRLRTKGQDIYLCGVKTATAAQKAAEFRIALHADYPGKGLGRIVAQRTLEPGFHFHGLQRIHLIVRKNNHRARKLYESIGFRPCGCRMKEVHGCSVEFQQFEHLHAP